MDAPVKAVAMITKKTDDTPTNNDPVIPEEEQEELKAVLNENLIVGNWEVQDYYREINKSTYDPDLESTKPNAKLTRAKSFLARFGFEVYGGAWNMFQDEKVHYKNGNLYRTEYISVFDDVSLKNPNANQVDKYKTGNVTYGTKGSSVRRTNASKNYRDNTSYTYNWDGAPYIAEDLDSLNIDFQPEVSWKTDSVYPYQDWDLPFGYDLWSRGCW